MPLVIAYWNGSKLAGHVNAVADTPIGSVNRLERQCDLLHPSLLTYGRGILRSKNHDNSCNQKHNLNEKRHKKSGSPWRPTRKLQKPVDRVPSHQKGSHVKIF